MKKQFFDIILTCPALKKNLGGVVVFAGEYWVSLSDHCSCLGNNFVFVSFIEAEYNKKFIT